MKIRQYKDALDNVVTEMDCIKEAPIPVTQEDAQAIKQALQDKIDGDAVLEAHRVALFAMGDDYNDYSQKTYDKIADAGKLYHESTKSNGK